MAPKAPAWLRIDPSELVLEIVSIVIAILLALLVNNAVEAYRTHQNVDKAIAAIRSEITQNRGVLEAGIEHHKEARAAYQGYVETHDHMDVRQFFQVWNKTSSHGFAPFRGETFAWDIARSSPEAVEIPYDLRLQLERTYAEQRNLDMLSGRLLDTFHFTSTDAKPDLELTAIGLSSDMSDIVSSEGRLDDLYGRSLDMLAAAR